MGESGVLPDGAGASGRGDPAAGTHRGGVRGNLGRASPRRSRRCAGGAGRLPRLLHGRTRPGTPRTKAGRLPRCALARYEAAAQWLSDEDALCETGEQRDAVRGLLLVVQAETGDPEPAIAPLRELVEKRPGLGKCLATVLLEAGQAPEAADLLRQILGEERGRNALLLRSTLARACVESGNPDEAEHSARTVLAGGTPGDTRPSRDTGPSRGPTRRPGGRRDRAGIRGIRAQSSARRSPSAPRPSGWMAQGVLTAAGRNPRPPENHSAESSSGRTGTGVPSRKCGSRSRKISSNSRIRAAR
ncbi:tetratricopeptide repeat protein [Amycolatopsis sp. M39]|uniref:tetratricopeptide repeat protein n=1 Tax=Amycolatopsis sp. M39 TaxID=1825094 RepID=UPI00350E9BD7